MRVGRGIKVGEKQSRREKKATSSGPSTPADSAAIGTPDWLSDGTDGRGGDADLKPAEWFKHPIVVAGGLEEGDEEPARGGEGEPEEQCRWM